MHDDVRMLEFEKPIAEMDRRITALKESAKTSGSDISAELRDLDEKAKKLKHDIYGSLTEWQRVQLARHPKRPYTLDYIAMIFDDFIELHGDRAFADDRAMVCGMAFLDGEPVAVIGQQKGRTLQENMDRNFGSANPEGYRKALRVMKLAEKFGRPVITFIDTPGAYPGIAAEERGQAEAIARNLREMAGLKIPVISVTIGEGGSGGALGIGVSNRILMLENAYYSVISPEGCAAILFRDATKAAQAATALKITAVDLKQLGIVDEIIPEPLGGAHRDPKKTAESVKESILRNLAELNKLTPEKVEEDRYRKFRDIKYYAEPRAKSAGENKKPKKASKK
ncbi:MAG: acetyl-CoA carboxylase carboxyltransferase subunit alpha [Elusimicrobiota bacterium]